MTSKKVTGLGSLPQGDMFDDIPDYTKILHRHENNPESQKHLEENEQKFVGQCAIVISLLEKGIVLSTYTAITNYRIGHLARRIKDIRDSDSYKKGAVKKIEDQYEYDSQGKITRNKIWFMRDRISEQAAVKYKIEWKK
jgi:hypothetical protein